MSALATPMTAGQWLRQAGDRLRKSGSGSPELDSLILLEDATGKDRAYLLAHPETVLPAPALTSLEACLARRAGHEPLSYIRGKSEFYGRTFAVNAHTLQPRPETETMVEVLLGLGRPLRSIIDVGTGSGCLAITAKLELPDAEVSATDISRKCLAVARQNAKNLRADVNFYHGDLLTPLPAALPEQPAVILANLPYVPDSWQLNSSALFEPRQAIFGGPDGLDVYRELFGQLSGRKFVVLTEAMPPQHVTLGAVAADAGYSQLSDQDFIQVFTRK